jgi:hypothetical protein
MRPARYFGAVAMQRHLDYTTNLPENIQTKKKKTKKKTHTTYKLNGKEIVVKNVIQFLF